MRTLLLCAVCASVCLHASDAPAVRPQAEDSFEKEIRVTVGYRYLTALPVDYEKQDKWPLLLFLHGSGEVGTDLSKLKKNGPPKLAEVQSLPLVLVSPQSTEMRWDVHALNALLEDVVRKYKIDQDRVYVTGLSLGGGGTWHFCAAYPDKIAAAVPVCGWNPDAKTAEKIKNIPFWAFHGDQDKAVPLTHTIRMTDALKKLGASPKLTVYPGVGHESWNQAYAEPELIPWLLSQRRKSDVKSGKTKSKNAADPCDS